MAKRKLTDGEKRYLELVKSVPCVCCTALGARQQSPTDAHHPRDGVGLSQRAGHYCAIALCYECHQGPLGIHGNRTVMRLAKLNEWDMHDLTQAAVFEHISQWAGGTPF